MQLRVKNGLNRKYRHVTWRYSLKNDSNAISGFLLVSSVCQIFQLQRASGSKLRFRILSVRLWFSTLNEFSYTAKVPKRVRFWLENVHYTPNHSSAYRSSQEDLWSDIFMPKSYTFRNCDGTSDAQFLWLQFPDSKVFCKSVFWL